MNSQAVDGLSDWQQGPLRRAMETISQLRAELDARKNRRRLAVVGLALRAGGGVHSLGGLSETLYSGLDLTTALPKARRNGMERLDLMESVPDRGGWLSNPFGFDAPFFSISPREARAMDPQHRTLLELVWESFESAAIPPSMYAKRTGVFIGTTGQDYRGRADGPMSSVWTSGNGHSFAAGRIAYTLGFNGPALAVDSACSSSLTGLHLAANSLALGECDVAVVGGVNMVLSGQSSAELGRTGALSPTGKCRPFDAYADGFVRGEGCVVLLLKRLEDAWEDGNRVLSTVEASGINQDGRSAGFTAPNPAAQVELLRSVLSQASLEARDIAYVQAHGTGTPLGDPIEIESISEVLGEKGGIGPFVTSVKANLGHLEAAAGLLGVASAIIAQRSATIPPQANLNFLSSRVPQDRGVVIPETSCPWPEDRGKFSLVESFGMSGTNACVILGPPPTGEASKVVRAPQLPRREAPPGVLLSGHDEKAIARLAAQLLSYLQNAIDFDWPSVLETLWYGREILQASVVIYTTEVEEVKEALHALIEGRGHPRVSEAEKRSDGEWRSPREVVDLPPYPWGHTEYLTSPRF